MATGKRGAGPGSYTKNGVNCTMNAPFDKASSPKSGGPGIYDRNKGAFDQPANMSPTDMSRKFYDTSMGEKPATTLTAGQVSPPIGGTQAVGTRRFKNAK